MRDGESTLSVAVSDDDHAQGGTDALVTLLEYGDYQCPACGQAYPAVKQVQRHYGNRLRFVFRNFPLSQAHPMATPAAELAEAAARLGRFWDMHDWLYENQDLWVTDPAGFGEGVHALGLDEPALEHALRDPEIAQRIRQDFMSGVRSGVNGTPSFFLDGRFLAGGLGSLADEIEAALGGSP